VGDIWPLVENLSDISISRPRNKVFWGIEVPDDPDHTIYVWLDALLNYNIAENLDNRMIHFVGKDISKFHAIIWVAICKSIGIDPPEKLFVHGHWTINGEKMSKSKCNVVDPFELVGKYGMDGVRYVLLRGFKMDQDCDFSEDSIENLYNNELANQLGNLISRCTSSKLLSAWNNSFPDLSISILNQQKMMENYENGNFNMVIESSIALIRECNQIFFDQQVWKSENKIKTLSRIKTLLNESEKYLYPIIPNTCNLIKKIIRNTLSESPAILFPRFGRRVGKENIKFL
jgi:methionyl-tRNA synthetase